MLCKFYLKNCFRNSDIAFITISWLAGGPGLRLSVCINTLIPIDIQKDATKRITCKRDIYGECSPRQRLRSVILCFSSDITPQLHSTWDLATSKGDTSKQLDLPMTSPLQTIPSTAETLESSLLWGNYLQFQPGSFVTPQICAFHEWRASTTHLLCNFLWNHLSQLVRYATQDYVGVYEISIVQHFHHSKLLYLWYIVE